MRSKSARLLAESYSAVAPSFLISAWCAKTSYVQSNAAVVTQFNNAMRESATWANAHHAASGAILASATKMNLATVAAMTRSEYALRVTAESVQPSINVAAKYGGLETFDARELVWSGA